MSYEEVLNGTVEDSRYRLYEIKGQLYISLNTLRLITESGRKSQSDFVHLLLVKVIVKMARVIF